MWRTRFGRPVWQSELAVDLTGVCVRAGVRRLTPHGLRHAANTLLIDGGVPAAVVRQLAGHATESMADLYTGRLDGAARRAVDALADRLV